MRARSNPPARPAGLLARVAPAAILVLTVAIPAAHAADWQLTEIDEGTKPALALTPSGDPVIVYMLEDRAGWVRVASLEDGAWRIEQTSDGYFYGPPDIAIGIDGTVHAAFHDHQAPNFRPDKGDAVYLRREDGVWTSTIAMDGGHDGWDNRVTTDADGRVHMVAMDPVDFGGGGVEYYRRADDGTWQVEPIDSGPQTYRWAISIAMDPDGGPWITYYDARSEALKIAHRGGDGWVNDVVDADGDAGRFSELTIGDDGSQHVSYYRADSATSGAVRYATRAGPDAPWQFSDLGTLDDVVLGFTGARNITSLALDSDGSPWVAFSDESRMDLAHLENGAWVVETVVEASGTPLGQILSLEIDGDGHPHIAYALVTDKNPLNGSVWYATRQ